MSTSIEEPREPRIIPPPYDFVLSIRGNHDLKGKVGIVPYQDDDLSHRRYGIGDARVKPAADRYAVQLRDTTVEFVVEMNGADGDPRVVVESLRIAGVDALWRGAVGTEPAEGADPTDRPRHLNLGHVVDAVKWFHLSHAAAALKAERAARRVRAEARLKKARRSHQDALRELAEARRELEETR